MRWLHGLVFAGLVLAGCQSVSEMPLSQREWRIEGEGRGLLGKSGIDNAVLKQAASLSIREGYPRFAIIGSQSGNRTEFGGYTPMTANTNPTFGGGYNTTFSGGQPMAVDVRNTSVVVRLFRESDPGFDQALDAKATLARLSR